MAEETIAQPKTNRFNTIVIFNVLGILAIVALAVFIYDTVQDTDALTEDSLELSIQQLAPQQAYDELETNNDSVVLIDVRTPAEWQNSEHIEGAISIPVREFEERALEELPDKDAQIIVLCDYGNHRSMKAAEWLIEQGYSNVNNLDGGLRAWIMADLPTVRPNIE